MNTLHRHVSIAAEAAELKRNLREILRLAGIDFTVVHPATKPTYAPSSKALLLEYSPATWHLAAEAVAHWRFHRVKLPIVLIAIDGSEEAVIRAVKLGAAEYIRFPGDIATLPEALRTLIPDTGTDVLTTRLIGVSTAMDTARDQIRRVARTNSNVLITGETGTGKEVVAQSIHEQSPRAKEPFVCVNCAAIPDGLLESELFGYEKGAFTGAQASSEGKIRMAHKGTLFLDEIGEMSPSAQAKILRAIDTREVWPLGARRSTQVDVRIVAATNREIDPVLHSREFRADLYFRLSTTRIALPPLRERIQDIPSLLNHFTVEFNNRFDISLEGFSDDAIQALLHYTWPGNIRELRNVMESVYVNFNSPRVEVADLPARFSRIAHKAPTGERERLVEALCETDWNISSAAQKLLWSRMTMYRKIAKYQVGKEERPVRARTAGSSGA